MTSGINSQPNIVVIGGGTGTFTLLRGLKNYTDNLTALVNMSDDGGSTGTLRDEMGVLPPGDVRKCLMALSDYDKVRDLFEFRFTDGKLDGHSFGNLFISAAEKMTNSFEQAIDFASEFLRVKGKVVPVTLDSVTLVIETKSGQVLRGEHWLDEVSLSDQKPTLRHEPEAKINPKAKQAILDADVVVIAPGDIYGSLGPVLIIDGIGEALANTKAKIVQVTNLVTQPGHTDEFAVSDIASEVERLADVKMLDYVIFNTDEPTKKLLDKYTKEGEFLVKFDLEELDSKHYRAIGLPLISKGPVKSASGDKIAATRTLIRHDSDVVAREVMKIYFS